jgi:hypothetical protein
MKTGNETILPPAMTELEIARHRRWLRVNNRIDESVVRQSPVEVDDAGESTVADGTAGHRVVPGQARPAKV